MVKKDKLFKINYFRILLCIAITIVIVLIYMYIENKGLWSKDFVDTDYFKRSVLQEIQTMETAFYWEVGDEINGSTTWDYLNKEDSNIEYIADVTTTSGKNFLVSNLHHVINDNKKRIEEFKNNGLYYKCSLNELPETNIPSLSTYQFKADQGKFSKLDIYVKVNLEEDGSLLKAKQEHEANIGKLVYYKIAIAFFSVLAVTLFVLAIKKDKIYNNFGIKTILILIAIFVVYGGRTYIYYGEEALIYLISYVILSETFFYIVRQIKKYKKDVFIQFIRKIKECYKMILALLIATIVLLYFVSALREGHYFYVIVNNSNIVKLGILLYIIAIIEIMNIYFEYIKLKNGIKEISKGNYQTKIETNNIFFKGLFNDINNIKEGMENATNEQIKSERLKIDLITNVSHDLKTPLTSIINYTNLLKKENIQNDNAKQYIEVLENKSQKLKNLTEDLIEASKISSGNETVNLERLDFKEIVLQANGEFAEKFETKNLTIVNEFEDKDIYANIDSKKMWRVLENIYNNIYKYALENTRVYVDLKQKDKTIFKIRNISKNELNISPDELMERFVRGDSSRTTTGNGLGLSIAKDLVKLQGGELTIEINGDLFTVNIIT